MFQTTKQKWTCQSFPVCGPLGLQSWPVIPSEQPSLRTAAPGLCRATHVWSAQRPERWVGGFPSAQHLLVRCFIPHVFGTNVKYCIICKCMCFQVTWYLPYNIWQWNLIFLASYLICCGCLRIQMPNLYQSKHIQKHIEYYQHVCTPKPLDIIGLPIKKWHISLGWISGPPF